MRASLTVLALGLLLLATAPLAGCGLKGDLYLPDEESTAPPQPGPDTRSENEDEEDESPASPPGA